VIPLDACTLGGGQPLFRVLVFFFDLLAIGAGLA
jgi:hypothetical protein